MNNNQLCYQAHIGISTLLTLPEGYTAEDVESTTSRYNTVYITMNDGNEFIFEDTDLLCIDKIEAMSKEHYHSSHRPRDEMVASWTETFTHTNK
jgi:hypothetical protein